MRTLTMSAVGICLLSLVLVVGGCQCGAGAPTATPTLPSTPMNLYENAEHGFTIEYPEGWTEKSHGAGTYFLFEVNDPEGHVTEEVLVEYKTEELTLAEAVSEAKTYMEAMPQFELISEGKITTGEGISGYEMVGEGDLDTGKAERFRYIVLVREKQVFWVGLRGEPADFDQQKQLVDTIIDSFKLLPSYTYVVPAPSPGGTYTNAEHGFSITYPAGWSDYTTGEYGEIVDLRAQGGLPEIMVRSWTEEITPDKAASKLKEQYSEHFGDYELLSEGEITLDDGTPAYEFVCNGITGGYLLTIKSVIVIREADVFLVQGFTMPAQFEQDEAVLDEVTHSFHLE